MSEDATELPDEDEEPVPEFVHVNVRLRDYRDPVRTWLLLRAVLDSGKD